MDRDETLVIAQELDLHDPFVRRSKEDLERLLAADFREVGTSGRVRSRATVIDELAGPAEVGSEATPTSAESVEAHSLAPNLILVTYISVTGERHVQRSSLWIRENDGGWRLRHHQGTPSPS